MKCSKCSSVIHPIVAVDVDGTLAEYHQSLTAFASRYFCRPMPTWDWDGQGEMEDFLGLSKAEWRDLKFAYRSGGLKRFAPLFEGGREFVSLAHDLSCEVWIATTRPWLRLDSIDPDTRWWLAHNDIKYDHLIYDEHKYPLLGELVDKERVIMVVDDLEEMLEEAAATFGIGVDHKIARPHNAKGSYPGFTFKELRRELAHRIADWRKQWHD